MVEDTQHKEYTLKLNRDEVVALLTVTEGLDILADVYYQLRDIHEFYMKGFKKV